MSEPLETQETEAPEVPTETEDTGLSQSGIEAIQGQVELLELPDVVEEETELSEPPVAVEEETELPEPPDVMEEEPEPIEPPEDPDDLATIHPQRGIEYEPSPEGEPETIRLKEGAAQPPEGWHPGGPEGM